MRLFIAINLPSKIKEKIAFIQNTLRDCKLNAKWVNPPNIHLTLKFLGSIPKRKVPKIKEALDNTAIKFKVFDLALSGFGFFPNDRQPRIFFINTEKEIILEDIYKNLEDKLEAIGFQKQAKFSSHITLARLKTTQNIKQFQDKIKNISFGETFLVQNIALYKSVLTKEGPIYEIIERSRLTA